MYKWAMRKKVESAKAPAAIGPYSQAIEAGAFLFLSGQIGINPETGELQEGVEAQARQIMENIRAVLEAAGLSFDHVVKTTIYLADIADFAKVNEIYGSYFREPYPARSTVAVAALPKGALVEIEVIARKS